MPDCFFPPHMEAENRGGNRLTQVYVKNGHYSGGGEVMMVVTVCQLI